MTAYTVEARPRVRKTRQPDQRQIDRAVRAQKLCESDHHGPAAGILREAGVMTGCHTRWANRAVTSSAGTLAAKLVMLALIKAYRMDSPMVGALRRSCRLCAVAC